MGIKDPLRRDEYDNLNIEDDDEYTCDACGSECEKSGGALYRARYKCDDCGIVYFDRREFNPEYKMRASRRSSSRFVSDE